MSRSKKKIIKISYFNNNNDDDDNDDYGMCVFLHVNIADNDNSIAVVFFACLKLKDI